MVIQWLGKIKYNTGNKKKFRLSNKQLLKKKKKKTTLYL